MRKVLANRLLWRGAGGWPANGRQALWAGSAFSVLTLGPWLAGVCGCTMFELGAATLVLAAALLGGNTVFGALTGEREKKTLDSLRLTQLTPGQLVLGKLMGEFTALGRLLAAGAPALLALAVLGGVGLPAFLLTLAVAALAGLFASVSGIFVSSLASTTSQAVLAGWALKGVWLLGTPILDLVIRAVFVQREPVAVFTATNPLAALGLATIPEAAVGGLRGLAGLYVLVLPLLTLVLAGVASRRLAQDPGSGSGVDDGRVHEAWRSGWGPRWLQALLPGLARNPSFLREVAFQARTGATGWPGYLVFAVLFLAPFLYARAWDARNREPLVLPRPVAVQVSTQAPGDLPSGLVGAPGGTAFVRVPGQRTTVVFQGHRPGTCLRLALYEGYGIPMPADSIRVVIEAGNPTVTSDGQPAGFQVLDHADSQTLEAFGLAPPDPVGTLDPAPQGPSRGGGARALAVGLTGTLVLFLLYLSVRCAGFLAGSLTGDRDRRNWQDLALSGIPASQVLVGKVAGALVFPLLQMTAVFPLLLLYVAAGSMTVPELAGLYVYAVALAITAGLLGLGASACSATTHASQGRAIGLALGAFVGGGLLGASRLLSLGFLLGAWQGRRRSSLTWTGWLVAAAGLFLAPQALSPLTAAAGFLPSLADWQGTLLGCLAPASPASAGTGFLGATIFLLGMGWVFARGAFERVVDREDGSVLRAEGR